MTVKHPTITWAQRSPHIYLSVEVEDMKIESLTVDDDSFKIKGTKGSDVYEADLQLFAKLNGSERRQIATDRRVELIIPKAVSEWWPRLLKDKGKVAWIKVDFDKWKDEDEEKDEETTGDGGFGGMGGMEGMDFSQFGMPGGAGGFMNMGGGGGMGGMGGKPGGFNMDDLDLGDEEGDDDEPGDLEDIDTGSDAEKTAGSPTKEQKSPPPHAEKNGAKDDVTTGPATSS